MATARPLVLCGALAAALGIAVRLLRRSQRTAATSDTGSGCSSPQSVATG